MHRNSNLPGNIFYKTTTAQSGQINAKMEKDVFKHKIEITWQSQIMHIKIREKEKYYTKSESERRPSEWGNTAT